MKLLDNIIKRLTALMADLIPTVDRLAKSQEKTAAAIDQMLESQYKSNVEMSELRLSNMKLAGAIEKLMTKIDKLEQFEDRLVKLERTVFK
jgi:hypothetical protein